MHWTQIKLTSRRPGSLVSSRKRLSSYKVNFRANEMSTSQRHKGSRWASCLFFKSSCWTMGGGGIFSLLMILGVGIKSVGIGWQCHWVNCSSQPRWANWTTLISRRVARQIIANVFFFFFSNKCNCIEFIMHVKYLWVIMCMLYGYICIELYMSVHVGYYFDHQVLLLWPSLKKRWLECGKHSKRPELNLTTTRNCLEWTKTLSKLLSRVCMRAFFWAYDSEITAPCFLELSYCYYCFNNIRIPLIIYPVELQQSLQACERDNENLKRMHASVEAELETVSAARDQDRHDFDTQRKQLRSVWERNHQVKC